MSEKNSFWKPNDDDVDAVQSFLTSRTGLIVTVGIVVAIAGSLIWSIVSGLIS